MLFRERQLPSEVTQHFVDFCGKEKLARMLVYWADLPSKAEAERLIRQGAVEIDNEVIRDPGYEIDLNQARTFVVRVGKKKPLFEVVVRPPRD